MPSEPLPGPAHDPAPIFEIFRGSYGTELLTAACAHFNVFGKLAQQPLAWDELRAELRLEPRPAHVLLTALRAMGLIATDAEGRQALTDLSREHLVPGAPLAVDDYLGLAGSSPGVLEMVARLRSNRPAGADADGQGTAFIYRAGQRSAMEQQELARHFTLALAGRARNVAPALAEQVPLGNVTTLLDVGGGTGIYSIALLRRHPRLRAVVLDRPEVLRIADEFARRYEVADRLQLVAGDMFDERPLPEADVVLLSNVLHDWDVPECRQLTRKCADALTPGGHLLVHDVFLNDDFDGPLPIALYSAALFTLTEGRAYSAGEYAQWLTAAGLETRSVIPTRIHCGVLPAVKPG